MKYAEIEKPNFQESSSWSQPTARLAEFNSQAIHTSGMTDRLSPLLIYPQIYQFIPLPYITYFIIYDIASSTKSKHKRSGNYLTYFFVIKVLIGINY